MYLATVEWKNMGMEAYCIEQNGKEYVLGPMFRPDLIEKFDVGYINPAFGRPCKFVNLYAADNSSFEWEYISTETPHAFITVGDVPIIQINREEKIRGYQYKDLVLWKTEFVGYTIPIVLSSYDLLPMINHCLTQEDANIATCFKDEYGVCDLSENPVEDFRNLNFGEEYILYWYAGTDYHEEKMTADCKVFEGKSTDIYEDADEDELFDYTTDYTINGSLTKNGYAEFDLSDVEPGYYAIMRGGIVGIIEITD